MKYKTYILEYTVKNRNGAVLKSGKMRVKNAVGEMASKVKLEAFLKKKHPAFAHLIVYKCYEDNPIYSMFNGIFGK